MSELTACLSGMELFQQPKFQCDLIEVRSLISCPDNIFRQLYLTTLYRVAETCQAMPFSEKDFNDKYGFLERQLKLVITVLKLRRGILLPMNASTEQISAEEAQWTYALFTGGLLKDLHLLQFNREVYLQRTDGEQVGIWVPLSGTLYEKNRSYTMNFVVKNAILNNDILMAALSGQICPPDAVNWLSNNPLLFKQWWSVILHQAELDNDIEKIITVAAEKCGIGLMKNTQTEIKTDELIIFQNKLLKEIKIRPEDIFRMQEGLFVSFNFLDDFLSENQLMAKNRFIEKLEKDHWLILNDGKPHHQFHPKKYEDKRVLRGLIVNIDKVPEALLKHPVNLSYQKRINKI